jgi:hypothetical protein
VGPSACQFRCSHMWTFTTRAQFARETPTWCECRTWGLSATREPLRGQCGACTARAAATGDAQSEETAIPTAESFLSESTVLLRTRARQLRHACCSRFRPPSLCPGALNVLAHCHDLHVIWIDRRFTRSSLGRLHTSLPPASLLPGTSFCTVHSPSGAHRASGDSPNPEQGRWRGPLARVAVCTFSTLATSRDPRSGILRPTRRSPRAPASPVRSRRTRSAPTTPE